MPEPLPSDLEENFPVSYQESLNTVLQVTDANEVTWFFIDWNLLHSWKFRGTIPWSVWSGEPWRTLLGLWRAPSSCRLRLRTPLRPSEKPLFPYPGFFRSISNRRTNFQRLVVLSALIWCTFCLAGLPQRPHPAILHQESGSKSRVLQRMDRGGF